MKSRNPLGKLDEKPETSRIPLRYLFGKLDEYSEISGYLYVTFKLPRLLSVSILYSKFFTNKTVAFQIEQDFGTRAQITL